jgi:hypothetical protein
MSVKHKKALKNNERQRKKKGVRAACYTICHHQIRPLHLPSLLCPLSLKLPLHPRRAGVVLRHFLLQSRSPAHPHTHLFFQVISAWDSFICSVGCPSMRNWSVASRVGLCPMPQPQNLMNVSVRLSTNLIAMLVSVGSGGNERSCSRSTCTNLADFPEVHEPLILGVGD